MPHYDYNEANSTLQWENLKTFCSVLSSIIFPKIMQLLDEYAKEICHFQ